MKKTLLKLAIACALALPDLVSTPSAEATKCASCSEQFRACKEFCGTNNPIFTCQGSSPCGAVCTCP